MDSEFPQAFSHLPQAFSLAGRHAVVTGAATGIGAGMVEAGEGGAIVNISSVDGLLPCLGVGYDVAKAGVNAFTRSLAVDLAPHSIRVNCVAPGLVVVETLQRILKGELPPLFPKTDTRTGLLNPVMAKRQQSIPLARMGTPEDIGNAVLYLCSDAASYVTGQVLAVDGGWTLV